MAAIGHYVVKIAAVVGSIPVVGIALGYRVRINQADVAACSGSKQVCKICDLPRYIPEREVKVDLQAPYPCNGIEEMIGTVRKAVQDSLEDCAVYCSKVTAPVKSSLDDTRAIVWNIQPTTGDLTRAAFIGGVGASGYLLAHKNSPLKKLTYGLLASVSCCIVCYPWIVVGLYHSAAGYVQDVRMQIAEAFLADELSQVCEHPEHNLMDCYKAGNFETTEHDVNIGQSAPENKDIIQSVLENKDIIIQSVFENKDIIQSVLENKDIIQSVLENKDIVQSAPENKDIVQSVLENKDIVQSVLEDSYFDPSLSGTYEL